MTKITTDFAGGETIAVTKQRLTDILAYWGASTAAYTTWGQARTALNALLTSTTAGTIGSTELAGTFLPKINFLNDPDEMIADALFGAGEQGVWFDPSDVANLDWRRNLLLWTEQFNNPYWTKIANGTGVAPTVTANAGTAPDGTATADRIQASISSGSTSGADFSLLRASPAVTTRHRYSVYLKSNTGSNQQVTLNYDGGVAPENAVVTVTSAWTRFDIFSSTGVCDIGVRGLAGAGAPNQPIDILAWGAQLEAGSTATDYQRITDLNTEVIERFPNATMYQDAAGTIPVTTPGQPVGLRLDKSKGLVLGAELVTNGSFATDTAWTKGTGWTISGGAAVKTAGTAANLSQSIFATDAAAKNKITVITFDATVTAGSFTVSSGGYNTSASVTSSGSYSFKITSAEPSSDRNFYVLATSAFAGTIDNVSVKALEGNHAVQSTAGSRLTYGIEPKGGRRNLLTWSDPNLSLPTGWLEFNPSGTATRTLVAAPAVILASYSSHKAIRFQTTSGRSAIYQAFSVTSGVAYTASCYIAPGGASPSSIVLWAYGAATGVSATKIVSDADANGRLSVSFTPTSSGTVLIIYGAGAAAPETADVTMTAPQLETGSTATNYQRVTTAFDVTEAGVNTCHYCQYDGSDDGMVTNSIDFTGTDKMSVFAGVRKNSDAAFGVVAELGATGGNGSFTVLAPSGAAGPNYRFSSRGTSESNAVSPSSYAAPITNLLTGIGNIAGDSATLRINGVEVTQSTTDQGTGNFVNAAINIGRRNNTNLPFNGRDYGIIVTGKLANATAIATTEMWLANKTSGVTL